MENTFRHVNIALVGELAMLAGDLGIDVREAIDAGTTKSFGHMRFTSGPGVGGRCLPSTPATCRGRCAAVWVSRMLLLGSSYKKNTGDALESPSHVLVRQLQRLGPQMRAADPQVLEVHAPPGIPRVGLTPEELAAAEAPVADHDAFDLDAVVTRAAYVLDCRRMLPTADHAERLS